MTTVTNDTKLHVFLIESPDVALCGVRFDRNRSPQQRKHLGVRPSCFLAVANWEIYLDVATCPECEVRELARSEACETCGYHGTNYHADWCPAG